MLTKGVAPNVIKLPTAPLDQPNKKEVPSSKEIVLATLPLPAKGDLKSKDFLFFVVFTFKACNKVNFL